jgi:monovalent cation/hydrogen antiporter
MLSLSPVITLECYAITLVRIAPSRLDATSRIPSYAVWDVAVFVLNVLAFILAGLQLRPILTGLHGIIGGRAFAFAAAVFAVVVIVRVLWVMSYNTIAQWKNHYFPTAPRHHVTSPTVATELHGAACGASSLWPQRWRCHRTSPIGPRDGRLPCGR